MRSTAMQAAQSIDKNEYTRNIKHVFIRMLDVYCIYCTFPKHMLSEIHTLLLYIVDSLHTNTYRITARMSLLHAKYRRNQENCTKILVQSFGRQSALYKPFIQQRLATIQFKCDTAKQEYREKKCVFRWQNVNRICTLHSVVILMKIKTQLTHKQHSKCRCLAFALHRMRTSYYTCTAHRTVLLARYSVCNNVKEFIK